MSKDAASVTPGRRRILTGLQPSGQLHLGNYCGAIQPLLGLQEAAAAGERKLFVFVASYHALTSVADPAVLRANCRRVVIDYLAFGLDPAKINLYLQQDVPAVTELAWLLACVCPKAAMDRAVAYKEKVDRGAKPSLGLFTYPVLQAADILGVRPDAVPVGADQTQNVEYARDLAGRFNRTYGDVFKVPELLVRADGGTLPGVDGEKMSKSYGNTIDPFMDEKPLRKRIMKIKTDSADPAVAKDPEASAVFRIFSQIAGADDLRTLALADRYRASGEAGMGYGEAKQALFELVMDHFGPARARRAEILRDDALVDGVLREGAAAANAVLAGVMDDARRACGLR
ncbi:tryptophan--tRNA ligase [Phycisphaera mikurensis]|uniref:Tryptophan--tRNA ligase n=1 Tax=Phycisphaera mikurensis (strain NBRC 102666 / KCTC 22515 / FYK2301M01) TaxID=1142394 RepID=I0IFG2_PHYMF|nr:tryptophan--tRNA ligase [Phycisphaera mikurensis]MBB6440608.1 tryptophanyl-tRNA synthetase [Phycisphaera mikurensis]BAM04000.1 tryptophanyl-tRNA synthetase [Phycisphaera mikurensis NBRC 102666]